MENNGQIQGVVKFLTKLTHTVDMFNFKFINVEVGSVTRITKSHPQFQYDLEITTKENDIPFSWDFFSCKSNHIIQDGCEMVGIDWNSIYHKLMDIYINGMLIRQYENYLPEWFGEKIDTELKKLGNVKIESYFFCEGLKKDIVLDVNYELSGIYWSDGLVTDISVYCRDVLVNGESLEGITEDIAETIVGYMSELDAFRYPLDEITWREITKYMDLQDCEIWGHTYTYFRNIGDIEVEDFNYVAHSTFSSKMCDFISGEN